MRSTKELFGHVPQDTWKTQHALANRRIELAKEHLNMLQCEELKDRDTHAISETYKAIKFWERLRDEAHEYTR